VASGSDLPGSYNYVRNSVKVVINAYTGKMTFYVMTPNDPIIETYEKAFPGMFTPASKMSAELRQHIRYPEDIFTVQATMYGKYHITRAASFYSAADAWTLSPDPGAGSPSQQLATTQTVNAQGQVVSTGQLVRMSPIYQVMRVPGQTTQTFTLLDAFVPVSSSSQIQNLSGFMIAGSDPGHYGQLNVFVTPRDNPPNGPALVAAKIDAQPNISSQISLLNQNGSSVLLGNLLQIPFAGSLLYIQPLYVESSRNPFPELQRVIAVYGNQSATIGNSLSAALTTLFAAPVQISPTTGGSTTTTLSPEAQSLLAQAQASYTQAQADLKAGNLAAYQNDINAMESSLQAVQALTGGPVASTTTTTTNPNSAAASALSN
jgi:uncharacterized membrane protein (UPF0182 family)